MDPYCSNSISNFWQPNSHFDENLQIFIARETVQDKTKPKTTKEPKEKKKGHMLMMRTSPFAANCHEISLQDNLSMKKGCLFVLFLTLRSLQTMMPFAALLIVFFFWFSKLCGWPLLCKHHSFRMLYFHVAYQ